MKEEINIKRLTFLNALVTTASLIGTALLLIYALKRLGFSTSLFNTAPKWLPWAMLAAAVVFELLLIGRIFSFIERLHSRGLIVLTAVLFLLMGVIYVLILRYYPVLQITDALAMYDEAFAFAKEPGRVHQAGELYTYYEYFGNNYFLTLVFAGLIRLMTSAGIKDVYMGLNIFNCLCLMTGCLFGFLAVREACGMKTAVRVLVLLLLNPTFYVLSTWLYSCTVSIPFMTVSIYLAVKAYKAKHAWSMILCGALIGVFSMVSYYLRPTSMFPMIALVVVCLMLLIGRSLPKKRILAGFAAIVIMIAGLLSTKVAVQPVIDRHFSEVSALNFPIEHWLMLGSAGNGSNTVSGMQYTMSFAEKSEKAAACRSAALENYRNLGPVGTAKLWIKKIGITFSDGFSDMDVRSRETEQYSPFYRFIAGDHKEFLLLYSRAVRIVTFLMMMYVGFASFKRGKFNQFTVFAEIIFLGGLVFYALWEAKGVYSVPFVPVMLMIAAGDEEIKPLVFENKKRGRLCKAAGPMLAGAFILLSVFAFNSVCGEELYRENVIIYSGKNSFIGRENITEDGISQSFSTDQAINNITLFAAQNGEVDPEAGYYFRLLDDSGNVLAEATFTAEKIQADNAVFSFSEVGGSGRETYTIETGKLADGREGGISLLYQKHIVVDRYKGVYRVAGEERGEDLLLKVRKSWKEPYMTIPQYVVSAVLLTILLLLLARPAAPRKKDI